MALAAWVVLSASAKLAHGQGTGGPIVNDSKVGYIDCAIPSDVFRVRYDSTSNNRVPSRAEFFYAKGAPLGPGLPFPERSVDYQDISAYLELRLQPGLSGFLDVPARFLNPDINDNTGGFGDLNAGFKYALRTTDSEVLSFQLRTFVPTGDAQRGLGTNHVSLEPAILFYESLGERAGVEAECRYWVPIGGTDFAGEVVRYGIGAHYDIYTNNGMRLSPVVEVVGWTVLAGKESVLIHWAVAWCATPTARRSSIPSSACDWNSPIRQICTLAGSRPDRRPLVRKHVPLRIAVAPTNQNQSLVERAGAALSSRSNVIANSCPISTSDKARGIARTAVDCRSVFEPLRCSGNRDSAVSSLAACQFFQLQP